LAGFLSTSIEIEGGIFLRKMPLCGVVSVKSRIENAVKPRSFQPLYGATEAVPFQKHKRTWVWQTPLDGAAISMYRQPLRMAWTSCQPVKPSYTNPHRPGFGMLSE
jgi:hypothetical protein